MQKKWLEWAKEIQAIAQAGLTYTTDPFDEERFEQLRNLSVEILQSYTDEPFEKIHHLFTNETGYQTPKVDIRAVVFDNDKLLFVKEKADGKWALPGGWADINLSPKEIAVKEVKEEAGIDVTANKLSGIIDMHKHPHPPNPYHIYKILIQCSWSGGSLQKGLETDNALFFPQDQLPELSLQRNTYEQVHKLFANRNENLPIFLD
ncbi:NUDIX hydrolase [Thalassobacillus pellis]|uniref:NUDIX hydrolase n=1 Tax=Thalassobacillus pellis TaxID=748008 RepID=UPI001961108C|nr:NUDIX hydrolase [Thalassobacillus pellis]MBM7551150.1 ADP-ribose pyrophosphatase YjhB (NUDIX family) [Thalassobacillus pellis]